MNHVMGGGMYHLDTVWRGREGASINKSRNVEVTAPCGLPVLTFLDLKV